MPLVSFVTHSFCCWQTAIVQMAIEKTVVIDFDFFYSVITAANIIIIIIIGGAKIIAIIIIVISAISSTIVSYYGTPNQKFSRHGQVKKSNKKTFIYNHYNYLILITNRNCCKVNKVLVQKFEFLLIKRNIFKISYSFFLV